MAYMLTIILLALSGTKIAEIRLGPTFATAEECQLYHRGRIVAWTPEIASIVTYSCEPTTAAATTPTALHFDAADHDAA